MSVSSTNQRDYFFYIFSRRRNPSFPVEQTFASIWAVKCVHFPFRSNVARRFVGFFRFFRCQRDPAHQLCYTYVHEYGWIEEHQTIASKLNGIWAAAATYETMAWLHTMFDYVRIEVLLGSGHERTLLIWACACVHVSVWNKWECCSHWTENENEIVHNMKTNITTLIVTFLLVCASGLCESAPGLNASLSLSLAAAPLRRPASAVRESRIRNTQPCIRTQMVRALAREWERNGRNWECKSDSRRSARSSTM